MNKEAGLRHIYRAAQYGYGPAQSYLMNLGVPSPKIDPQLVAVWQADQARKQHEVDMIRLQAAIQSLKQQTCTTEMKNGALVQTCK